MATIGLPKSSSVMPVARHNARAPAASRPTVVVRDLKVGIGFLVIDIRYPRAVRVYRVPARVIGVNAAAGWKIPPGLSAGIDDPSGIVPGYSAGFVLVT
ncbi:hypothetical protein [Gordonia sp. CPCC 205333]|uniref:hypothetical protein n=1 Tax=Gordonia sp. CPCC 205333 TaxID=3140790 RepID=UPI003AF33D40